MTDPKQPVDWLRSIAKKRRGRVVSINQHDYNVCTSVFDWHDALDNSLPPPDMFRYKLKLKHNGRSITIRSNDRFIAVELLCEYAIESPFSINRQDRVCFMNIPKQIVIMGQKKRDAFICKGHSVPQILEQSSFWSLIDALNLNSAESIHVYRNGLTIYIQPDSEQRVEEVIATAANISDQLPPDKKSRSDLSELPQEFIHLIPLMRRWAEADDEKRTDRLASASQSSVRELVSKVAPLFAQINSYLDGFRDAVIPESALALGALAQCAAEAQFLLEKKNK